MRALAALALVGASLVALPGSAAAQLTGVTVTAAPVVPSSVSDGAQDQPAAVRITNLTPSDQPSQDLNITNIRLNVACDVGPSAGVLCAEREPRPTAGLAVFAVDAGTGRTGSACAGNSFLISSPDEVGNMYLTSIYPVVLRGTNATCFVDFTFDVVQRPFDGGTFANVLADVYGDNGSSIRNVSGSKAVVVTDAAPDGVFTTLTPTRIADSRNGTGGFTGPMGPATTADVQVAGTGGVPAAATAVALNVTVSQTTAAGYLTLYPSGSNRPTAMHAHFMPGRTLRSLVMVKLGADGGVAAYNSAGTTHVMYDVVGYYSEAGDGSGGHYQALGHARIADTRFGHGGVRLGPGQSFDLQVAGNGGAPATGAEAAVLNVAVTSTTAASSITVYPTGGARPSSPNLTFVAGETASGRMIARLGSRGRVTIHNAAGSTDVVVDLNGTYSAASAAGTPGRYVPLTSGRILDTRTSAAVPAGATVDVQVTGRAGMPSTGVRAVVLNVAAIDPAGSGFLTVYPTGTEWPGAADLNYTVGESRANLVVVPVRADGKVTLLTSNRSHVVLDVAGWFS